MNQRRDLIPSLRATYDSAETGPRYWVTSTIDGRPLTFQQPIADPFVRHTVHLGWRDLLRGLLRRRLTVEVTVGAPGPLMDDVLELDAQSLIPGRTRHEAFHQSMHGRLAAFPEDRA